MSFEANLESVSAKIFPRECPANFLLAFSVGPLHCRIARAPILLPVRPCLREKRFCKECPKKIEDETHFILSCPSFSSERNTFLESMQVIYPNFSSIPTDNQKMIFLSTNEDGNFLSLFSQYLTTITSNKPSKNRASLTHP